MIHRKTFSFLIIKTLPFQHYFVRLISENELYLSIIYHFFKPGEFLSFFSSNGDTQSDKKWAEVGHYNKGAATRLHSTMNPGEV